MWITWFIRRFPARESRRPVLLARGGIEVCDAGPGREPVAVGEPSDVSDVGRCPGGNNWSDTGQFHQLGAAGLDQRLELGGGLLHLRLNRGQVGELLGGDPASGLARDVARADGREDRLGLQGSQVLLGLTGDQLGQ
jgi:hypothetical protein